MIRVVRTCYVGLDKSNLAVHKMAELPTVIVVLELMKYESAHFCQIHKCTGISYRLKCKDICKLKLCTKTLINLPWKTFSITNFKAEELWYSFYWTPNILKVPYRTSSLNSLRKNVILFTYGSLKQWLQILESTWLIFYNAEVHITNGRVLSLGTHPFLSVKVFTSK